MSLRRSLLALPLAGLAAALPAPAAAAYGSDDRRSTAERPNVIVVVTDDQPLGSFSPRFMPRTFKRFVAEGTEFSEAIVATPLCCPSRATLLTGQYGHNNGVLKNQYSLLERRRNVLPAWLKRAGYRTIHVGRFLNGYGALPRRNREIAPGWKTWRTSIEPHRYYGYRMRFNRRFREFGSRDRDYLTTNLNRIAANLVRRSAGKRRPFYLQLDHLAPHFGPGSRTGRCEGFAAVPGPADEDAYGDEPLPRGPSFDEEDISDKPLFMQGLAPIGDATELTETWRCHLAALREVDRGVAELWRALRERRALRDTAVIITSDNGYMFGEHRLALDKHYAYRESLEVPLVVRLPPTLSNARPLARSAAPVANIDLAPTILELAGAEPCLRRACRTLDGRSLVAEASGERRTIPRDRGIAVEYDGETPIKGLVCEYQGIRTSDAMLVEHIRARADDEDECDAPTGAVEHYELGPDPFELENLFATSSDPAVEARRAALRARSSALADCAGIAGRDPLPPSGHHCE